MLIFIFSRFAHRLHELLVLLLTPALSHFKNNFTIIRKDGLLEKNKYFYKNFVCKNFIFNDGLKSFSHTNLTKWQEWELRDGQASNFSFSLNEDSLKIYVLTKRCSCFQFLCAM